MITIMAPVQRMNTVRRLASAISVKGFRVIIQPVDFKIEKRMKIIVGGISPQARFMVVDLGAVSNSRVRKILEYSPESEGRLIVIGAPDSELVRRNVVFCDRQKVAETIGMLLEGR